MEKIELTKEELRNELERASIYGGVFVNISNKN